MKLTVEGSWAERKLFELINRTKDMTADKPYVFATSCVGALGADIDALNEDATECTYEEMAKNCDLSAFERVFEYGEGFPLQEDQHVTYYKSLFQGVPCYYLDHSRIEYIWVNLKAWAAVKMVESLERRGFYLDIPDV